MAQSFWDPAKDFEVSKMNAIINGTILLLLLKIDLKLFSAVILFHHLIQKGELSVTSEKMCTE